MVFHPNLDPELAVGISQLPMPELDLANTDLPALREQLREFDAQLDIPHPGVMIEDVQVPGPDGEVRVRVYRPEAQEGPLPGLVWIHGGGMIIGSPEGDDAGMVRIVNEVGAVVVSVDYRLAPEHPYPAPVEDCYAALAWTAKNAAELGIDADTLALGGASAGGGLAAATALLARDRGGPALVYQWLVCPMLDDRNITPSSHAMAEALVWTRASNLFGWNALLGGREDVPIYAAPARAEDLSGLPPAFVDVGELEVFRDECMDYALRLARAGVSTEFHLYPGAFHAFDMFVPDAALSRRASGTRIEALRRALHPA